MSFAYQKISSPVHRLIPSRFPPVSLFDWAETPEELVQIAALEGLTNDRLLHEYGSLSLVKKEDWVSGEGSTPLMAAFTHPGLSRFSDGGYGIYYAGLNLETAIAETRYHREHFLRASSEAPCCIQMREYIAQVEQALVNICDHEYGHLLNPDRAEYPISQSFGRSLKDKNEWGIYFPSVRSQGNHCVAILRPPALSIPHQGCHLDYIWDGQRISEIRKALSYDFV